MSIAGTTVMTAVASVKPPKPARIVVAPALTPVTGTVTVVAFAAIVTVAGTVAVAVEEELMLTVNPPGGAGPDKVRVRFLVSAPFSVIEAGARLMVAVTFAACVAWV